MLCEGCLIITTYLTLHIIHYIPYITHHTLHTLNNTPYVTCITLHWIALYMTTQCEWCIIITTDLTLHTLHYIPHLILQYIPYIHYITHLTFHELDCIHYIPYIALHPSHDKCITLPTYYMLNFCF